MYSLRLLFWFSSLCQQEQKLFQQDGPAGSGFLGNVPTAQPFKLSSDMDMGYSTDD